MKKILVPCDFSEHSINAFRFALDIAVRSTGTVHLVNVIELPAMPNSAFTPVRALGLPHKRELNSQVLEGFEKIILKYKMEGVKIVSKVEFGSTTKTLLNYIRKNSIDLVVIGSRGTTGLKAAWVGSNTEKIVRSSPVPVIVVKGLYTGPVSNIVFPFTAEMENQKTFIARIKDLQTFFKATLHIVYVNTPANFTPDTLTTHRMNSLVRQFKLKDYTLNVFNHTTEEDGIIEFAKSMDADLIAMATHGRKGLSHFMYGSKTENVANKGNDLLWTSVMKTD